ncbi:MAG TPA: energy transducer TonB [Burkholderiales bacterium]|nr:energy transducer TonB [Burkholderiales bacterium]
MRPDRIGLGVTLALHALVAAFVLSYEPARKTLLAMAPIMVDLITPPAAEPHKPQPPTELPKPKPVTKQAVQLPVETPILAVPAESPSPIMVAPQPPAPPVEVVAPPAPPVLVTQPIYNADYLENPSPYYPAVSRRAGEQGRVILRVLVNVRGTAEEVQVRTSSGFPRLDDSARDTVRRWKFVPAKRGSEPVQAWVLIPISFRLEG